MNISSTTAAISAALTSATTKDAYSIAVAGKALDAQKQEGQAALELIASATGKGRNVNTLA